MQELGQKLDQQLVEAAALEERGKTLTRHLFTPSGPKSGYMRSSGSAP